MNRLLIVAGNYQQAVHWADQWGLKPSEWRYVTNEQVLRGTHGARYVTAGLWYMRSDWPAIRDALQMAFAVEVEMPPGEATL